jgi:hypothetical protein
VWIRQHQHSPPCCTLLAILYPLGQIRPDCNPNPAHCKRYVHSRLPFVQGMHTQTSVPQYPLCQPSGANMTKTQAARHPHPLATMHHPMSNNQLNSANRPPSCTAADHATMPKLSNLGSKSCQASLLCKIQGPSMCIKSHAEWSAGSTCPGTSTGTAPMLDVGSSRFALVTTSRIPLVHPGKIRLVPGLQGPHIGPADPCTSPKQQVQLTHFNIPHRECSCT